jgi:hypothetical protein
MAPILIAEPAVDFLAPGQRPAQEVTPAPRAAPHRTAGSGQRSGD